MFPKHADPAKVRYTCADWVACCLTPTGASTLQVKAHHDHVHSHFDLSLLGMSLEHWAVVFVLFGLLQVRRVSCSCV